jgi:hypothetical protein
VKSGRLFGRETVGNLATSFTTAVGNLGAVGDQSDLIVEDLKKPTMDPDGDS